MSKILKISDSSLIHPILLSVFPILFIFSVNIQYLEPKDVVVPFLIIFFFVCLIWLPLRLILKNSKKAGLIISLGLVLFFIYGHLFILVDDFSIYSIDIGRHQYLLIPFLASFIIGTFYLVKSKRKLTNLTMIVNGIAASLVILSIVDVGIYSFETYNFETNFFVNTDNNFKNFISLNEDMPDVYYIILDEYAGSDVLIEFFDYDNQEFLKFLKNNEFYVIPNAHSNYPGTDLSLASSLNMGYIDFSNSQIANDTDSITSRMINKNIVMQNFQSLGYTTINFNSGIILDQNLAVADKNLCGGNDFLNSELLIMITRTTMLNPIYVTLFQDDKREKTNCVLSGLVKIRDDTDGPIFVFAHLLIPHSPFVFGSDGEEVKIETLDMTEVNPGYKEGYINQLQFTNKKMKEVITHLLLENNTPPIIILQADHGSALTLDWENPTNDMIRERMTILNAYYLPENGNKILYDDITPVNSFRLLFNNYFESDYEILDDKMYFFVPKKPYTNIEITDILK